MRATKGLHSFTTFGVSERRCHGKCYVNGSSARPLRYARGSTLALVPYDRCPDDDARKTNDYNLSNQPSLCALYRHFLLSLQNSTMARLRKPSPTEQAIFLPPASGATARTTRSSPRKNVTESPSTRKLRYTSSQDSDEDSFLVPKAPANHSPVRRQRVLRPMASNASLVLWQPQIKKEGKGDL